MTTAGSGKGSGARWGTRSGTQADVGPFQGDLFAQGQPAVNASAAVEHLELDGRSWIEVATRWLQGGDELLEHLAAELRWTRAERPMYGQMVEEPRLGAHLRLRSVGVPTVIDEMASALGDRYRCRFNSVWVNYYRGGRDSVAWHSDRIGIDPANAVVAIVSLGGPRRFLLRGRAGRHADAAHTGEAVARAARERSEQERTLRPVGGGRSRSFTLASGDLLVMGGSCQQDWEHSIPKVASAPPRMSVTFRRTGAAKGR
ncbi:MAG: alpha-ketoglutarate-dependent dioxygenase AlkB [Acidimicrobiaceae bacterium]|nr:alpha-ketoglutarate-dependent dioxygenase AlkB [Acidimicrobiaceae bacterium]MXY11984.1 alpha-ketoglutarate-dependent dioxygenase AlkB [Acidimicrobiaceae bacterium]MXZ65192.1 alpha-ketoglutarate-dependent dioxygenase AlkB [Acidimicrobiaceae bacterium]MYF34588.1 alpha-ketoglutarate-dependent dioxygenase AlkB [Acidimicrobiaceae bacterium]MYG79844.1 alpha-ketoglutarate-dependent dioxygenase AlkB [Acidimicrobiaceae bacterium]